jgi:hypothetical protein
MFPVWFVCLQLIKPLIATYRCASICSQDYDSLSLSLESSDRIRRQQKELIAILQQQLQGTDSVTDSNISFAAGDASISRMSAIRPPIPPPSHQAAPSQSYRLGPEASHFSEGSDNPPNSNQFSHTK